jgi:hypothetical protein
MNAPGRALPEITIGDFRSLVPATIFDLAVDDIGCNPGWRGIVLAPCDTLQERSNRHLDVVPVTAGQIKAKLGELHFFYDGSDDYCQGAVSVPTQLS